MFYLVYLKHKKFKILEPFNTVPQTQGSKPTTCNNIYTSVTPRIMPKFNLSPFLFIFKDPSPFPSPYISCLHILCLPNRASTHCRGDEGSTRTLDRTLKSAHKGVGGLLSTMTTRASAMRLSPITKSISNTILLYRGILLTCPQ